VRAQKEGEEGKLFTGSPPRAIHPHIPDREGCGKLCQGKYWKLMLWS